MKKKQTQPIQWEKISFKLLRSRLIYKIQKQLIQLSNKNINKPIKKRAEYLHIQFPREDIQMAKKHRIDAQQHLLIMKCKLQPQWGTTMIRTSVIKISTDKRCTECGELLHCGCAVLYCCWEHYRDEDVVDTMGTKGKYKGWLYFTKFII